MSGELVASLVLKLNDQGSAAATRALAAVTRATKETGDVAKSASAAAISAAKRTADAREVLGIRAEKAIQNEIRQTEAAYQRLASSGQAGARELARAQEAVREKVGKLRQELDGVKQSAGGAGSALTRAMSVVGGLAAGRAILAGPVTQTMSYDRQLAHLSNTAYAGQSMDARRGGMRTLDAAIMNAVRVGGGTREGAMGTLDKLVASGAFSDVGEATRLLPVLTKAGTAANADPAHLADIAIRAKQTFGLKDTGLALDQAMRAGQLGGFELKDMAKWLPQQMAMARQSGLRGDEGFKTLLAANQAVAITAGTKDEAGNNLVNLLAKINSQDTAKDAQKLGINLSGTLAAARGKGVNSLDAFVNLTEQIVGKDKNFAALRAKSKTATGDEQRATYDAMGDILQGSSIGKIVQDRQALMGLVGIMNNRDYMGGIRDQLGGAKGTAADAFGLIAGTPSYQAEQLAAEKAISMQAALDKVNPLLGGMAEGVAKIMRDWPAFSAAIVGSATALFALAAAASTAAIGMALFGGKGMAGAAGGMIPAGAGAALGAAAKWGGGALAAGAAGYAVGGYLNDGINSFVKSESLGKNDSLGSLLYDMLHREKEPTKVEVAVKVENGNLVAEVNKAGAREAARH